MDSLLWIGHDCTVRGTRIRTRPRTSNRLTATFTYPPVYFPLFQEFNNILSLYYPSSSPTGNIGCWTSPFRTRSESAIGLCYEPAFPVFFIIYWQLDFLTNSGISRRMNYKAWELGTIPRPKPWHRFNDVVDNCFLPSEKHHNLNWGFIDTYLVRIISGVSSWKKTPFNFNPTQNCRIQ